MQELLAVLFLFPCLQEVLADSCTPAYSQHNMKLIGHVVATYSAVHTSDQCSSKCGSHAVCHSINFYSSQGICEVNNANHLTNPESLVYSLGCKYVNYFDRAVSRCSDQLCSYPLKCSVGRSGQDYICSSCKDQDRVLHFPTKMTNAMALYENPFVKLTAFTISLWMQTTPSSNSPTPFGYATTTEDNEILIIAKTLNTHLRVNEDLRNLPPIPNDNRWHHVCVTWTNLDGSYSMYIDGVSKSQGTIKTGHVIQKGAVVLGQDQDSYKGGFDISNSFQGNLTGVNVWDKVLTANEVSTLASKCSITDGNVIKWTDFYDKISGNARLICSSFCESK